MLYNRSGFIVLRIRRRSCAAQLTACGRVGRAFPPTSVAFGPIFTNVASSEADAGKFWPTPTISMFLLNRIWPDLDNTPSDDGKHRPKLAKFGCRLLKTDQRWHNLVKVVQTSANLNDILPTSAEFAQFSGH